MATTCRPKVVRRTTNSTITVSAAAMITITGMPATELLPSAIRSGLRNSTSCGTSTLARPRTPTSSASVATIGCTPT